MDIISSYLNQILIFSFSLAFFSVILGIICLVKISKINKKAKILFSGKEAKDLESVILDHSKELEELDKEIQQLFEISNKINSLAFKGIHKAGIIRFNPFKDIGGDQSFAIALLDGKNNGLVISSLHTKEGTRVYAKPISKGQSEKYTLTEEEKTAIKKATSSSQERKL